MKKRILTTSIPSWSQLSGADTFSSLFEGYDAQNVANIYVHSDMPDSKSCAHYFHIIENNVIKSVFNRKIVTGRKVLPDAECEQESNQKIDNNEKRIYSVFTRYRFRIFLWLRELGWKLGKWNSKELNQFIADFNPEVFVFPIESYGYFNRINEYIIDKYRPKTVIGFLWDDNFTYKQHPYNIFARVERFFVRRSVKRLVAQCDKVLAICPKMKTECDKEFNISSIVVTKPRKEVDILPYTLPNERPIRLVYTGSLVIGRYGTIKALVEVIQKINHVYGNVFYLDVYSQTQLSNRQIKAIDINGCSRFNGAIRQSDVFIEQQNSDILVFVENMNNTFNNVARLSFSTKITDYLSAGRTILAIGPDNISSIEYFKDEGAAVVCSSCNAIYDALLNIMNHPQQLSIYSNKSIQVAEKNHNVKQIRQLFWELLGVK